VAGQAKCGVDEETRRKVRELAEVCASAVEVMHEIQISGDGELEISRRGREAMTELICAWLEREAR
jgi:hypothetical protein